MTVETKRKTPVSVSIRSQEIPIEVTHLNMLQDKKALLQLANFTLGPDATLNTEIHENYATLNTEIHKNSVRIKAPNSVNASKRKHKNQINHYNKQRRVLMANSTVCQSK